MGPLGDRRPSALFAEMHSLLPQDANVLFNAIYLRCLPESMRAALADRGELLPGDLTAAADLLHQSARPSAATIAAAVPLPPSPHPSVSAATVYTPSHRFQSRSPNRRRRFSPQCRPPTPHRSRNPLPRPPPGNNLCFYHFNFGRQARRCQPPCSWQGNV
jgi:hypothetical protein